MTWRTAGTWLVAAGLALGGCASSPGPGSQGGAVAEAERPASPDWRTDASRAASRAVTRLGAAAEVTAAAARAAGEGAQTAARGLRSGFERPEAGADYGPRPAGYADAIRTHFRHVLRLPEHASLRVGRPRKGYMNDGLLRGGAVAWRGYLVDVEVTRRASLFGDELRTHGYVVRLRDGEIIDVHKGVDHEFLGFVD